VPGRIPPESLARLRAATQLIHRPTSARDPAEIARSIAGAQAQDVYAGPQTFRSRSRTVKAADIKRARTEDRSLLRTWLMRRTIHLIASEDAGWMLPLFEPGIERLARRVLERLGMPARHPDKALRVIARALDNGPMTRGEVKERVREAGIELVDSRVGVHVIVLAVTSGVAILGPDRGSQSLLVRREDWLGKAPPFDREKALAELARRYLSGFGPAIDRDFAYWSGLPLRDVRTGLASISREIEEVTVGGQTMLTLRGELPRLPRRGQVRMLGNFDTYLLGWKDREFAVSGDHALHVKAGGGGWIRPVIVEDGIVVGGWRSSRMDGRLEISLNLPKAERERLGGAIEAEIADLARFEGVPATIA
jgi:Winged helix DNA-binding domain